MRDVKTKERCKGKLSEQNFNFIFFWNGFVLSHYFFCECNSNIGIILSLKMMMGNCLQGNSRKKLKNICYFFSTRSLWYRILSVLVSYNNGISLPQESMYSQFHDNYVYILTWILNVEKETNYMERVKYARKNSRGKTIRKTENIKRMTTQHNIDDVSINAF